MPYFQVEGRHASDGEAVAPVNVGHGQEGPTIPGRVATLATCWRLWSDSRTGSISLEQKISPRVRILPSRGISQRYASIWRSLIISQ